MQTIIAATLMLLGITAGVPRASLWPPLEGCILALVFLYLFPSLMTWFGVSLVHTALVILLALWSARFAAKNCVGVVFIGYALLAGTMGGISLARAASGKRFHHTNK